MIAKTKFFIPHSIRLTYGSVFDRHGEFVDLKARGLDGLCVDNKEKNGKHYWLMLPPQMDQKDYLICLNCYERSHL